jgi:tRNA threonylcarbamoyladenosine dehydratase
MATKTFFSDRMKILVGEAGFAALSSARVAVYGLGGVGAACAMDLVRSGVGNLYVVDFDKIDPSNLNRLYFGYESSVGEAKVDAFSRFAREVNPGISIRADKVFFSGNAAHAIVDAGSDIHADCIDSLNPKVNLLAELCQKNKIFIASMGTAGRLAPERLKLGKIWSTAGCPLARSVRIRLRHLGVTENFPVVWSDEPPVQPIAPPTMDESGGTDIPSTDRPYGRERMTQGSGPFVPQAAGHIMASWIVRRILADASA